MIKIEKSLKLYFLYSLSFRLGYWTRPYGPKEQNRDRAKQNTNKWGQVF